MIQVTYGSAMLRHCTFLTRCNALPPLEMTCFWTPWGPTLEPCGEYLDGKGGGNPLLCPVATCIGLWDTMSTLGSGSPCEAGLGTDAGVLAELFWKGCFPTAALILRLRSTM